MALEAGLESALAAALETPARDDEASEWLHSWYAPEALRELLAYRDAIGALDEPVVEVARIVLSRAARSARRTTHSDLDFPRSPQLEPYWCHKHKRICRPVAESMKFLRRYTGDTIARLGEFSRVRSGAEVSVVHGDARTVRLPVEPTGVITSPPYPGLIDYHEQHRYAYELLGLDDRRVDEIGPAAGGNARPALRRYVDAMVAAFRNARAQLPRGAPVVIVVNDSKGVYREILRRSGLRLEERRTRHVNRRTGRRAGEFFEDVLVCSTT